MPFKIKHVFKGPAKVLNAVGNAGLFGQRGDHFRVAGIKVGKDLVPVVQGAAVVATVAAGGPALASACAIPEATAIVAVSAGASATVTGLSGGNESQVATACAKGAATAYVGNVANAAATIPEAVTIHVAGNTGIAVATSSNVSEGIVGSLPGVVGYCAPTNIGAQYMTTAAAGAVLNDNPLRGALQSTGVDRSENMIQEVVKTEIPSSRESLHR